jgi:hypothetical protein
MKRYLFNVQITYAVIAESEEIAREILDNGEGETRDRDVLLVEVDEEVAV